MERSWGTHSIGMVFLAVVGLAGLLLRLPAIGDWSLYRDDAWQSLVSRVGSLQEILIVGVTDPGYALGLRLWTEIAGDGTESLLIPALVAGVLLIPAATLLARHLGASWPSALVAGGIMATGELAIAYSGRVKPFTWTALGTIVVIALAYTTARRPTGPRLVGYAALGIAAFMFSAPLGTVVVVGGLVILVDLGISQRQLLPLGLSLVAVSAAVMLIWYMQVLEPATSEVLYDFWRSTFIPVGTELPGTIVSRAKHFIADIAPQGSFLPSGVFRYFIGVLAATGALSLAVRRRFTVLALLLGPILLALLLSILSFSPFGGGRTDLYLYPLVAVLACLGLEPIVGWMADRDRRLPLGLAGVVLMLLFLGAQPTEYVEDDGRAITGDVLEAAEPADVIITLPETSYLWARYAPQDIGVVRDRDSMTGFTPTISDERVLFLPGYELTSEGVSTLKARQRSVELARDEVLRADPRRVWVIEATLFDNPLPELDTLLRDLDYSPGSHIERPAAEAHLYVRSPTSIEDS